MPRNQPLLGAATWRRWRLFRRYALWFAAGALALLATNALAFAIPARIGEAVALLAPEASARIEDFARIGIAIIALALGAGAARVVSRIFIFNAGRFIEFDVRNELYAKLAGLDAGFFARRATGDITSRVTNDVTYVRLLYAITFLHLINTAIAYVIALWRMIPIDPWLTIVCFAPYPVLVIGLRYAIRALFHQTKVVQAALASISADVQENLSGIAVVKAFRLERREIGLFTETSERFYGQSVRLALIRGALSALTLLVAGAGTLVVLAAGAPRVLDGSLSIDQFVEFNGYVVALAFPTQALGWVFSVWHRGRAAFERITELVDEPYALQEPDTPRALPALEPGQAGGRIELEGVRFAYPDDASEPVLDEINLTIEAGSRVALVGPSGSGKSTLLRLLSRTYDPDAGAIRIDGIHLRDVSLRALRAEIGFVPQDPFLFSMSVGANLRFGLDALERDPSIGRRAPTRSLLDPRREAASQRERAAEAIRIAGLEPDLAALPEGLETIVGERGVTLSGGQKQRLTLARALLVDPRVLVLDDALASVDARTEALILAHLEGAMGQKTCVIATQRFGILPSMDRIFVLDRGRIVDEGTHAELSSRPGPYATLFARARSAEAGDGDREER